MAYTNEEYLVDTTVLSSDFTMSSTTFADVTGFSLPVKANTSYEFEYEIIFTAGNSTGRGVGFGVNGPASPTSVLVHTEITTSLSAVTYGMARAYNTGTATSAVDIANTNMYARCYGAFVNGANAGNLILSMHGNSNVNANYVCKANSVMRLWRINPSN